MVTIIGTSDKNYSIRQYFYTTQNKKFNLFLKIIFYDQLVEYEKNLQVKYGFFLKMNQNSVYDKIC